MSSVSSVVRSDSKPTNNDTVIGSNKFTILHLKSLETVDKEILKSAVKTYQKVFAQEPYCEFFSDEEVQAEFKNVLVNHKGDLVFGKLEGRVVSLAIGYPTANRTYYIADLAVSPDQQNKGYGRTTAEALLKIIDPKEIDRQELRTTIKNNDHILALYKAAGFVPERGEECVFHLRQDGKIALENRVYLSKPALSDEERLKSLKHIAIIAFPGTTTAVIFDQLLDLDRTNLNAKIQKAWGKQHPDMPIEQCCFVTLPKNPKAIAQVEMFDGKSCDNATKSAIWILTQGKNYESLIDVSGVSQSLAFKVQDGEVSIEMPLSTDSSPVENVVSKPSSLGKVTVIYNGKFNLA